MGVTFLLPPSCYQHFFSLVTLLVSWMYNQELNQGGGSWLYIDCNISLPQKKICNQQHNDKNHIMRVIPSGFLSYPASCRLLLVIVMKFKRTKYILIFI